MSVPIAPDMIGTENRNGVWAPINVDHAQWSGIVYSLDVPKHHKYVADGLVTCNSIYSFRGGKVQEFLDMAYALDVGQTEEPGKAELIYLETNYRSHSEICSAANNLIAHNQTRLEKHTISAKGRGGYVDITGRIPNMSKAENEGEEIGQVVRQLQGQMEPPFDDTTKAMAQSTAILTRTNAIAYAYRTALKAAGIPVKEAPKPDMPKDWPMARAFINWMVQPSNDMLAYFYEIATKVNKGASPADARKEAHAIRKHANAAGQTIAEIYGIFHPETLSAIPQIIAERRHSLETRMIIAGKIKELGPEATLLDLSLALANTRTAEPTEQITDPQAVNVTTIHGAKGLEFDIVYLVGCEQEIMPGMRKNAPPDAIEEERRLCYVAITRARKQLNIRWCAQRKTDWGAIEPHHHSQFIDEVLK